MNIPKKKEDRDGGREESWQHREKHFDSPAPSKDDAGGVHRHVS